MNTRVEAGSAAGYAVVPYAESVTPGHPDIACNVASDNVLDYAIEESAKYSGRPRVALEVTAKGGVGTGLENLDLFSADVQEFITKHGLVVAVGEITLPKGATMSFKQPLIDGFRLAGYNNPDAKFYPTERNVLVAVNQQSTNIDAGVQVGGAGDQGAMVGFASKETPELMPLAMMVARGLTQRQFEMFQSGFHDGAIKPDGKSQITLRQRKEGDRVVTDGIENVTVAVAHDPLLPVRDLREVLLKEQILPVLAQYGLKIDNDTDVVINGAGDWNIFGPEADAGTENRKLMVQSYGLAAKHGGGGYSGKDPTKVDRSGALFARHIAVSLVAAGVVDTCEIVINFSIGVPTPHVIRVNTYGTNAQGWTDEKIAELVNRNFAWTVPEIIDKLNLFQPIYVATDMKGTYGVAEFPWEQPSELR